MFQVVVSLYFKKLKKIANKINTTVQPKKIKINVYICGKKEKVCSISTTLPTSKQPRSFLQHQGLAMKAMKKHKLDVTYSVGDKMMCFTDPDPPLLSWSGS